MDQQGLLRTVRIILNGLLVVVLPLVVPYIAHLQGRQECLRQDRADQLACEASAKGQGFPLEKSASVRCVMIPTTVTVTVATKIEIAEATSYNAQQLSVVAVLRSISPTASGSHHAQAGATFYSNMGEFAHSTSVREGPAPGGAFQPALTEWPSETQTTASTALQQSVSESGLVDNSAATQEPNPSTASDDTRTD